MSNITICLTNWKRPTHLSEIVDLIAQQNVQTTLFLWNNGDPFYHPKIDWMVQSSINKICSPRWFMAASAITEYVCILDDDMFFTDDSILSDILKIAETVPDNTIIGPAGVRLIEGKDYMHSEHLYSYNIETNVNTPCDIIKGSMMFFKTEIFKEKANFHLFDYDREEDIVVSSMMANGKTGQHLCLTSFGDRFLSLGNDEFALWHQSNHFEARELACSRYFREGQ